MPESTEAVVSTPSPPPVAAEADQVEQLYRDLEASVREFRPTEDLVPLEKAFRFAASRHIAQKRASGEPYMVHPLLVTRQLAEMHMDMTCLETGLLHDVVEDTSATLDEIRKNFGDEVARCVDGVTKLGKLNLASREERQAESVRKMLLAMVNDIRVILVKLADRLHNMRTLGSLPREKQERIAQETLDIYAPIAHRLGMGKIRGELEDLAFHYLEPEASAELLHEFEVHRPANEAFLNEIRHTVEVNLAREGIPARVEGRVKRAYSVFGKAQTPENRTGSGLRSAGRAHHHGLGQELLRGAGRDPQRMAPHPRPHQGFYRHPAAQSVPVPAHLRDGARRPPF
jgi:guanosine-3',5'-bis(diphosphate) 3'-pyrophosphohydrolase